MPSQACLDAIRARRGVYCGSLYCAAIQPEINEYCRQPGIPPNTPVPQYHDGKLCYCCCGGAAADTQTIVQTAEAEYTPAHELKVGDTVLATGLDAATWSAVVVTGATGVQAGVPLDFMFETVVSFDDTHEERRRLVSAADHLYVRLGADDRGLASAESLRPGDRLLRADGGAATVVSNERREFSGGIQSIFLGEYDGGPLDGHLLNVNGLVSADYGVQAWAYSDASASIASVDAATDPKGRSATGRAARAPRSTQASAGTRRARAVAPLSTKAGARRAGGREGACRSC